MTGAKSTGAITDTFNWGATSIDTSTFVYLNENIDEIPVAKADASSTKDYLASSVLGNSAGAVAGIAAMI